MTEEELQWCLNALVGDDAETWDTFTSMQFADKVLGFEDYDTTLQT
jgi:hypothetical protein